MTEKNKGGAPRKYPEEVRQQTVAIFAEQGAAAAARAAGVDLKTVQNWARDAGVVGPPTPGNKKALAEVLNKRATERQRTVTKMLTQVERTLERMNGPYIAYMKADGQLWPVEYPEPPARELKEMALAVTAMYEKIMQELGPLPGAPEQPKINVPGVSVAIIQQHVNSIEDPNARKQALTTLAGTFAGQAESIIEGEVVEEDADTG